MNKQHVYLNKLTKSHNACKTCSLYSVGHCVWVWTKSTKGCRRSCAHNISPCMLYSKKNDSFYSCKTCSIQNLVFTVIFMSCWSLCVGMNKIHQGV